MSEVIDVAATTPENEAEDKEQESKWIEMQAQEPHSWYFRKRHQVYCQAHCQEVALKKLVKGKDYFDDKAQAIQYWEQQKEQASANTEEHVEAVPPISLKRKRDDVLAPNSLNMEAAAGNGNVPGEWA